MPEFENTPQIKEKAKLVIEKAEHFMLIGFINEEEVHSVLIGDSEIISLLLQKICKNSPQYKIMLEAALKNI